MSTEDRIRLRHIVEALETTIRFTEGHCRDDLDRDEATEAAPELLAQIKPLLTAD